MLRKVRLATLLVIFTFVLCIPSFLVFIGKAETAAVVWTDKKEYFPDEIVSVFGYGFNPFANVTIHVVRPDLVEHYVYTVTDEFGYFSCEYQFTGVQGMYTVTATDEINTATTTFSDPGPDISVKWDSHNCTFINVEAKNLDTAKSYYLEYFDPDDVKRRTSPTYTGVTGFFDYVTVLPNYTLGTWTVKLYEDTIFLKSKTKTVDKMVWSTDSTYTTMVTSFAQGETAYFKAIGLKTDKYYKFKLDLPNGTHVYVGVWTTGVTNLTVSYTLPSDAQVGTWKVHVIQADDATGSKEKHYVNGAFFIVSTPAVQYYLTVLTDPAGLIPAPTPSSNWYYNCTNVELSALEYANVSGDTRYRFDYWDVDGANVSGNPIQVHMDANHTATAHYLIQYYLNMTSDPLGVTIPAGSGWYNESENPPIFAPEFISITPGESRYRFDGWTTEDMSEISNSSATSTTVFMDKPKNVTANYVVQYKITFNQTGVGYDFADPVLTVHGSNYSVGDIPVFFWWDNNSVHDFAFHSPLVVSLDSKQYVWASTTGLSSLQSDTITVTTSGDIVGNYKTQYYLAVISPYGTPGGMGWYDSGDTDYATLDTGVVDHGNGTRRVFTNWSGDASGTNYTQSDPITMDQNKTAVANWQTQYYLTLTTSSGGATDPPSSRWSDAGTMVSVEAVPDACYVFDHWLLDLVDVGSANPYTVLMDDDHSLHAVFTQITYQLTITTTSGGMTDPVPGVYSHLCGSSVGVTAIPEAGYRLDHWVLDGSPAGSANPISVVMDANHDLEAVFAETHTLIIAVSEGGTTDPSPGTYVYETPTNVVVEAIPSVDYLFDHWELDGEDIGSDNPITVYVGSSHSLKAVFIYSPPLSVSISPLSKSIMVGNSVTFTSTVGAGTPPYTYQWYLNNHPVSGATSESWTFTAASPGNYYIYLKVTDDNGVSEDSNTAHVSVAMAAVGGPVFPIKYVLKSESGTLFLPALFSTVLIAIGLVIVGIARKRKK